MSEQPGRKDIIQAILSHPKLTDEEKSLLVEELIEELKREYPELKYHATKSDVKETELKLTKEIKEVEGRLSKEIKELDLKFTKEIETVRKEIKEVEGRLSKEIKELDLKLSKEIENTKFTMLKWQFIFWISQISVILALGYKLLH